MQHEFSTVRGMAIHRASSMVNAVAHPRLPTAGVHAMSKLEIAKQTAAGAALRKQERECNCHRCIQAAEDEKLQAVLNILNARSKA